MTSGQRDRFTRSSVTQQQLLFSTLATAQHEPDAVMQQQSPSPLLLLHSAHLATTILWILYSRFTPAKGLVLMQLQQQKKPLLVPAILLEELEFASSSTEKFTSAF